MEALVLGDRPVGAPLKTYVTTLYFCVPFL
jgi:hypothetical protein